jgi:hypothetical protein
MCVQSPAPPCNRVGASLLKPTASGVYPPPRPHALTLHLRPPSVVPADNEIILDPEKWESSLPHTISAVFYPEYASAEQKARAREVHTAFLQRYQLSASVVPLVVYDPIAGRQYGTAFALADED